jgi:hypothetical protein
MTPFCKGVEWYDFSRSHFSLSFTIGRSAGDFPSYNETKKADGGIFDFDVFSPDGSEAELTSQDTTVAAAFDADVADCIYPLGFIPAGICYVDGFGWKGFSGGDS